MEQVIPAFPRTSIDSLPTETLLAIFRLVKHAQPRTDGPAPSLGLEYVCRRWLDVLAMDSVFWTTLSVDLDGPFIPSIVTTFLTAVRRKPFNVVVTSGNTSSSTLSATEEHARLTMLMRHLEPHFGESAMISLRLDITYRSSVLLAIPYLTEKELYCLSELRLNSRVTDVEDDASVSGLTFPELTTLHVDAKTFIDIHNEVLQWPQLLGMDIQPFTLVLTRYRPKNGHLLSIDEFIEALESINTDIPSLTLAISDVGFDPSSDRDVDDSLVQITASVRLTDLDGPFIKALFAAFIYRPSPIAMIQGGNSTVLTRCDVEPETEIFSDILRLEKMHSRSSIINALESWILAAGSTLAVVDCSGLDDSVLDWMVEEETQFSRLRTLVVVRPVFSAESLQKLAKVLLDHALTTIQIVDGPPLEEEISGWFADSEELKFSWSVRGE